MHIYPTDCTIFSTTDCKTICTKLELPGNKPHNFNSNLIEGTTEFN